MAAPTDSSRPRPMVMKLTAAIISGILVCAFLVASVGSYGDASLAFMKRAVPLYLVAATIFGAGGWWAAQTWQQLWRRGTNKWESVVFDLGVRRFGVGVAVTVAAISGWLGWTSGAGTTESLQWLAGGVLSGVVFGLPVGLHLGYFWGATFAKVVGIDKPEVAPNNRLQRSGEG